MEEKSKIIFSNRISAKDYKKALKSKRKYLKKYGDDSKKAYTAKLVENATLNAPLGLLDIRVNEGRDSIPTAPTASTISPAGSISSSSAA